MREIKAIWVSSEATYFVLNYFSDEYFAVSKSLPPCVVDRVQCH